MKKNRYVLILVLCGVMLLTLTSGCSSNKNKESEGNKSKKDNKITTYKMNEDIYITNDNGKYRVKFTNVTEIPDRNELSEKKADRVVIVEWEYENIDIEKDLLVSSMLNFNLYDKDNNKLETYPAGDTKYGGDISKGTKTVSSEAYALNNKNNYIELEYFDKFDNSKPDCKVILEW